LPRALFHLEASCKCNLRRGVMDATCRDAFLTFLAYYLLA